MPNKRDIERRMDALDNDDPTARIRSTFMTDTGDVEYADPEELGINPKFVE